MKNLLSKTMGVFVSDFEKSDFKVKILYIIEKAKN